MTKPLRLATRPSPLAMWQAEHVAGLLRSVSPDLVIEFVKVESTGDQVRDKPLAQIGGEGLFTKQIQQAVLEGRADIAVHSLKDLPTGTAFGLRLAAVPKRGPTGDALVSKKHSTFTALPSGAVIGTSSVRRKAQLLNRRPDLCFVDMRGNVETRLRKLADLDFDAIVLAQAGLERLGLAPEITEILDPQWMLPAVGQGALGLECRPEDAIVIQLLEKIDHLPTSAAARAERAMLEALGGGCQVPIGATTQFTGLDLVLCGSVLTPDGSKRISGQVKGAITDAELLGRRLAEILLQQGAGAILNR